MASGWVKVIWATRRNVYVNGNFIEAGGQTNTPFRVETGQNTFTLLTRARDIEAEVTKRIGPSTRDAPVEVTPEAP